MPVHGGEPEQLTDFAEPVSGLYLPDGRILLADEGHTVEKLGNRIDLFTRAVAFLDEVLGRQ